MDMNCARQVRAGGISRHERTARRPAVLPIRSPEFESDRADALEGVTEQIQALLAQDTRNPATLERLGVCFSLMRHLAGFPQASC